MTTIINLLVRERVYTDRGHVAADLVPQTVAATAVPSSIRSWVATYPSTSLCIQSPFLLASYRQSL